MAPLGATAKHFIGLNLPDVDILPVPFFVWKGPDIKYAVL